MNVINTVSPCSVPIRSSRSKMIYVKELDALVQESLLPDLVRCSERECEPPYGGKENCEFYQGGACTAALLCKPGKEEAFSGRGAG